MRGLLMWLDQHSYVATWTTLWVLIAVLWMLAHA